MKQLLFMVAFVLVATIVFAPEPMRAQQSAEDGFGVVLRTYVTAQGFRYEALRRSERDRARLEQYVRHVGDVPAPEGTSREALAFYINAYNALVLHAVLQAWPVQSVMEEPGFFDRQRHRVAGREMTLNQLENDILRARFAEPRIHFAINCASIGCPPLRAEPYRADVLERQLEAQARLFVRRTSALERGELRVSQIFEWFAADFDRAGGVRGVVRRYLEPAKAAGIAASTPIVHVPYDWRLNRAE